MAARNRMADVGGLRVLADAPMSLDEAFPPRGPCALCGDPDARHRIFDAIVGRHQAGETVADLAMDYDVTVQTIMAVIVGHEDGAQKR